MYVCANEEILSATIISSFFNAASEYGYYVLWSALWCVILAHFSRSIANWRWMKCNETTFPNSEDCTSVPWFERSINKEICDWFIWLFAPADNMWTSNRSGDASLRRAPVFQSFQHFTLVLFNFLTSRQFLNALNKKKKRNCLLFLDVQIWAI